MALRAKKFTRKACDPLKARLDIFSSILRYEPTNLELLARVFEASGPDFVRAWIEREPTGQYARRAAFLYEFLTGLELETDMVVGGNYVSALNGELVVTASQDQATNIKKWRVRDNMPGTRHFCPSIWKSQRLEGAAGFNIAARYTRLQEDFGDDMLARAAVWLTSRESKASFAIEGEADQTDKIALLSHVLATRTGKGAIPLLGPALIELQKDIIGPKTFISSFGPRKSPVFVGENTIRGEIVHYVAPPSEDLKDMLDGLAIFLKKNPRAVTHSACCNCLLRLCLHSPLGRREWSDTPLSHQ